MSKKFTISELEVLLGTIDECMECNSGACANAAPTKSEVRDIILNLIDVKKKYEGAVGVNNG